jgi:serine acetyltransferase
MILSNGTKRPKIHSSAYVASSAIVSGEVTIGQNCAILHGAVVVATGNAVAIGNDTVISEHAVVKSTPTAAVKIGDEVLVGPHATVVGVTIANGTRLPANEVRLPAGDPYGPTKAYAESLRKIHAKESPLALDSKAVEAPVEADHVVDIMMLELQEMEQRRAEAKRKK